MSVLNLFTRRPNWLFGALGLQQPQIPVSLKVDHVTPVVDVTQGGWADAEYTPLSVQKPASAAAADITLLTTETSVTRVLFALSIDRAGGVGSTTAFLRYNIDVTNTFIRIGATGNIPTPGLVYLRDILLAHRPLVVPPGVSLVLFLPATAVGETYEVRSLVQTIRAGYKPV